MFIDHWEIFNWVVIDHYDHIAINCLYYSIMNGLFCVISGNQYISWPIYHGLWSAFILKNEKLVSGFMKLIECNI